MNKNGSTPPLETTPGDGMRMMMLASSASAVLSNESYQELLDLAESRELTRLKLLLYFLEGLIKSVEGGQH